MVISNEKRKSAHCHLLLVDLDSVPLGPLLFGILYFIDEWCQIPLVLFRLEPLLLWQLSVHDR
jgi:hypothetical protein